MFLHPFFKICSFSHKKVMGYFRILFCTLQTFYRPVPNPMRKKKNLQKNPLEKSKNFTVVVSKIRVLGKKN